jgi:hypothetical protein
MWKEIDGIDLVHLLEGNQIESTIPNLPGIYAWRLNPSARLVNSNNYEGIISLLERLTQLPQGDLPAQRLNHSILLKGLEISGPKFESNKRTHLKEWLKVQANAQWLNSYLKELGKFVPNLYVGKADVLSKRVKEHLKSGSNFGKVINSDESVLTWEDLRFHWLTVDTNDKVVLEALEFITGSVSMSGFSTRLG